MTDWLADGCGWHRTAMSHRLWESKPSAPLAIGTTTCAWGPETLGVVTDVPWRPLFEDEGRAVEAYEALTEGVPPWLQASLLGWLRQCCGERRSYDSRVELLQLIERGLRWQLDWGTVNRGEWFGALLDVAADDAGILKLADFALAQRLADGPQARDLNRVLSDAGSAWTVGERSGRTGLVRRVPQGVQAAAEVVAGHGNAGRLLYQAWGTVYGLHPNPSEAYRLAVKAVEAAAIPVVSASNSKATLGTVIKQMEDQGGWSLPFDREHPKSPTAEVLLGMMRTLWHGQHDRHASGDPTAPLSVSQVEAESAVVLAVTLVQWFVSGAVRRT